MSQRICAGHPTIPRKTSEIYSGAVVGGGLAKPVGRNRSASARAHSGNLAHYAAESADDAGGIAECAGRNGNQRAEVERWRGAFQCALAASGFGSIVV